MYWKLRVKNIHLPESTSSGRGDTNLCGNAGGCWLLLKHFIGRSARGVCYSYTEKCKHYKWTNAFVFQQWQHLFSSPQQNKASFWLTQKRVQEELRLTFSKLSWWNNTKNESSGWGGELINNFPFDWKKEFSVLCRFWRLFVNET